MSYPSNPMELGEEWLGKVYGSDPPVLKDVPISQYLPKIPLRSTSHLLKNVLPPGRANRLGAPTPHNQPGPSTQQSLPQVLPIQSGPEPAVSWLYIASIVCFSFSPTSMIYLIFVISLFTSWLSV